MEKRGPSDSEKRREQIKDRIKDIYEESHHNYGAPKITEKLKFDPVKPDTAWVSNITYIRTTEDGFVYLSSIMDLFSRRSIAWTLSRTLEASPVAETVERAKESHGIKKGSPLVFHTDRGCQCL